MFQLVFLKIKCVLVNFRRSISMDFPVIRIFKFYISGTGWMQIVIAACDGKRTFAMPQSNGIVQFTTIFPSQFSGRCILPLSGGSSCHASSMWTRTGMNQLQICTFGMLENSFFWEVVGSQLNSDTGFKDSNLSASGKVELQLYQLQRGWGGKKGYLYCFIEQHPLASSPFRLSS